MPDQRHHPAGSRERAAAGPAPQAGKHSTPTRARFRETRQAARKGSPAAKSHHKKDSREKGSEARARRDLENGGGDQHAGGKL